MATRATVTGAIFLPITTFTPFRRSHRSHARATVDIVAWAAKTGRRTNVSRICYLRHALVACVVCLALAACSKSPKHTLSARAPCEGCNVILISMDTVRADHLGAYGYERDTSPNVDAFAADAVVFENAVSQSSWTLPAHGSMMTGLYPGRLDVTHYPARRKLPEGVDMLAEQLKAAGYATAGFTGGGFVSAHFGFDRGFDIYSSDGRRFEHNIDEALAWLELNKDRRFFLFFHGYDAHRPYFSHAVDKKALELSDRSPVEKRGFCVRGNRQRPGPRTLEAIVRFYDASIHMGDRYVGRLLDALREHGLMDESVVLVTSDHGEEFFEHGNWEHGTTLYGEQMRIPLIVKFPGQQRGRRRVGLAQQIDLLPTVLEVAGLAATGGHAGASLVGDGDGAPRAAFSYLDLDGIRLESVVDGRYKLIVGRSSTPTAELYDLVADPGETDDLFAERPTVAAYLELLLAEHRASRTTLAPSAATAAPELERKLKALGYLR